MSLSPLRYPGGKGKWAPLVGNLIARNGLTEGLYIEPFAGGAAVALEMARQWFARRVWINDLDPAVYSFWRAALDATDRLCRFIETVPLTMTEWYRQHRVWEQGSAPSFELGCAFFYLNRTNHSGIVNGAPIGGYEQRGRWKMDARFNRPSLTEKVRRLAALKRRVILTCADGRDVIREAACETGRKFVFADPPYYRQGNRLYLSIADECFHSELKETLIDSSAPWMVSYDDNRVIRKLYEPLRPHRVDVRYTAHRRRTETEIVYFSPSMDGAGPLGPTETASQ